MIKPTNFNTPNRFGAVKSISKITYFHSAVISVIESPLVPNPPLHNLLATRNRDIFTLHGISGHP